MMDAIPDEDANDSLVIREQMKAWRDADGAVTLVETHFPARHVSTIVLSAAELRRLLTWLESDTGRGSE